MTTQLLPVIDLLRGRVVRGHAGARATYQPWLSPLTPQGDPLELAATLRRDFQRQEAYVADLDALTGGEPQWELLARLAATGLRLWLDAGTGSVHRVAQLLDFQAAHRALAAVIVALESVPTPDDLEPLVSAVGPELVAFSLDLHGGRVWSTSAEWQVRELTEIAELAWNCGVRQMVVLDVAQVGTSGGPGTLELCRTLKRRWPPLTLVGGGGIHDARDVAGLAAAGCDRILVASALHAGRLTPLEVLQNGW